MTISTTEDEAWRLLDVAFKREPRLTEHGIGMPNGEDRGRLFAKLYLRDSRSLKAIGLSADWLRTLEPRETFNCRRPSHGLVRRVQAWAEARGHRVEISHGALLAAAIGAGWRALRTGHTGRGCYLPIRERSIRSAV